MLLTEMVPDSASADDLYDAFTTWVSDRGLELYPLQDEAVIELVSGNNVVLATPTGSGKSMVAIAAHFAAYAAGIRSFYTAPIKALVSEKFFALCEIFGADKVGMVTGDASVNASAPIICATAEIVANMALREGPDSSIGQVIMDEFHYYSEPDRGWAWQVPLIELPHAQFLLMSATLGDVSFFRDDLTRRTGRVTTVVEGSERPVPLMFSYRLTPVVETIEELVSTHLAPVYVVHFTQASALERAQALTSITVASKETRAAIAEAIGGFRFTTGFGKTLSRLVRHGIGVHHAGMLPRYRRLVEKLAQEGLLAVICGTDTLGVGINVPIRTVLLTGLTKYDGVRTRQLRAREFHQIAGRAGRAGYDTLGTVMVQAPEHEVENARLVAKAGDDPKKLKRIQRKKAPDGFVSWGKPSFERLVAASPEPLTSKFSVNNSMLLNVIARPGSCFDAMRHLLEDNHETRTNQRRHILQAVRLYRGLRDAGIVEQLPEPDEDGRTARLTVDLQRDFALNQPLSPFALASFELLDQESPSYALDVVSVIEATLDDPRQILMAQQHAARGEAVAQMKADGLEYEERMELLEEVTWPKPLADLLGPAFEIYRGGHPWLSEFGLSPKSVVRDMIEKSMTFTELISHYGLSRSEGSVLRYLADAYRALRQTVPPEARTEDVQDITEWLGETVRQVDSSLLDEWENLTDPTFEEDGTPVVAYGADTPKPISANPRAFRIMVRNALFRRVELASRRRWDLLEELGDEVDWQDELEPYFEEYGEIGMTPAARGPHLFSFVQTREETTARQVLDDPDGDHGWSLDATVDVEESDALAEIVFDDITVTAG
ncbi:MULTISPECIES: DEAD/DEAH box helicase [unclassified Rhodococcus (in: high G+C Gram-positive bacteria)]|uniref:DEAD/DEAH box helicase n=1 Tax=unclassified Rhodococcus (in: high G+C Gram-positive bacteria) TaxID=192944 RepID=UPI000701A303|nr:MULTISPECIES: DEAD/DEAH box helicase [unclassified Rhodococcus (in: high G+C Gram-positive bacteria)]KQU34714.1 DEAD/DEAH box helicase [Rhodococcus sp. Leaf225]KQU45476.1 DEAD/DEAH box helicase [Rhodococcus sp. Leaf258]